MERQNFMKTPPFQVVRLLAALLLLLVLLEPAQAQTPSPLDDQITKVLAVLKSTFGECASNKFFNCIANLEKRTLQARGNLYRTVNERQEFTEIKVSANLTPADAQRSFKIDADSYRKPPTNNVPPIEFWRTETFAVAGQADGGVLAAWLAPNPDSRNGSAFGALLCGNLVANFNMTLNAPLGGARDKALVDATQAQMKGLIQQVGQALVGAGACAGGKPKLLQLVPLGDVTPSVRNDADPTAVYPGDKVKVTGVVYAVEGFDGIFPKNPLNVQAKVEISQGVESNVQRVTTDAQGYYEAEYIVLDDRVSVIVVEALSPDPNRYESGKRIYQMNLKKRGSLAVTLATDKAVYAPGEPVIISGNVLADGKPIGAAIGFRSDILPLQSITSGSGSFRYTFTPGQEPKRDVLGPFQNGLHIVSAQAVVLGYESGSASAPYLVEQSLTCPSLSAQVVEVAGVARVRPIDPKSVQASSDPVVNDVLLQQATVDANTKLAQGLKVQTTAGARVALRFEGEAGAVATVAVNDSTTLRIERFCKDKSSGRIQAVLVVDGPGQVVVNKTTTGSVFSDLDLSVLVRGVRVKSVNTRYFVGVDSQGTTTVAALEGTVIVSMPDGANPIELLPLKRITIQPAEKPDGSKIAPLDGKIDPRLEDMLSRASARSPTSSSSPNLIPGLNPFVLLGIGGAAFVLFAGLMIGFVVVVRARARPARVVPARPAELPERPRPTDLPERGPGATPKPTDLPK